MHIVIKVKNRDISVEYGEKNSSPKKIIWQDKADISRRFLKVLDKINKCNKHKINCFFSQKSDSPPKPNSFVLCRLGEENTTWRIVLATLKALNWAGGAKLRVKNRK